MSSILKSKKSLLETLVGSPGFSTEATLSNEELARLRALIHAQFFARLAALRPDLAETLGSIPMDQYHTVDHQIDHKSAWPKTERILPTAAVAEIRGFAVMRQLEDYFGPYLITNEELLRPEEVYWRIVRPNEPSDVGPVHADKWFWDLGHGTMPDGYVRIKIWIPVYTETGKSGLLLFPDSHNREDIRYEGVYRDGFTKPSLVSDLSGEKRVLFSGSNGELVIFNDRLLHGGALNTGSTTRVSAEMTVLVREDALK
jgi:hypothetical protein